MNFSTAMGSPVSVTIDNLVMEDVEQRAISNFHTTPLFWNRYVDDVITVLTINDRHLNSLEPSIQFTFEVEKECKLTYLDTQVIASVHHKPIHTDKYLNFSSYQPMSHRLQ